MNYKGQFDENMKVFFTEVNHKAPDLSHLQGVMFADQHDLWPVKKARARAGSRPLPQQPELQIKKGEIQNDGSRETC